ncbi:hypothetical protein CK1_13890 [Ruminococcus sp. SR1/5]|nr:hypothetical protein CK1_13890 [Ruminococcus sp. SR1/5]
MNLQEKLPDLYKERGEDKV